MDKQKILLILLIENLMERRTCIYYQGDEEACLRDVKDEGVCTCNCNGELPKCEFLELYNSKFIEKVLIREATTEYDFPRD